jgi:hypothetical protein
MLAANDYNSELASQRKGPSVWVRKEKHG